MAYKQGFIPYALAALLIGLVGGFSTVLGPAFVQDIGIAYNNTTWTALAQAMSTAACAPILGKVGDVIGRRKTLLLGILVFTAGNVLSALANSLVFMLRPRPAACIHGISYSRQFPRTDLRWPRRRVFRFHPGADSSAGPAAPVGFLQSARPHVGNLPRGEVCVRIFSGVCLPGYGRWIALLR